MPIARMQTAIKTVPEYLSGFPASTKKMLIQIRKIIREAVPESTETISYGMPTYKMERNLIHFAGYKNHIGLYPGPVFLNAFAKEISGYETSKGTIRFPLDAPLPISLIDKIVKCAVEENKKNTLKKIALKKSSAK